MIAPSEPTRITVHRASRPSLASTPPKKTTTSPGKMNPANTDASAAGSRKIKTSASHGGKPSTCSMSQLTIDTTKALRRLNPSNDGVPAVGASPGAARDAGPGAAALGRHGDRARAHRQNAVVARVEATQRLGGVDCELAHRAGAGPVSYTHLRAHETRHD